MRRPELLPAIDALEEELVTIERQAAELRSIINMLCKRAGLDPRHAIDISIHTVTATSIKPDTFYGKKMQTAAREFLEMRKRADLGPAKPRQIFDALTAGGFQFETKNETISVISLRSGLRKNSATFHKLPNGEYGLKAWYQNVKVAKEDNQGKKISPSAGKSARKRLRKRLAKPKKAKATTSSRKTNPSIAPFITKVMRDGSDWTTARLRQEAIAHEVPGINASTKLSSFHAALLALRSHGVVRLVAQGLWRAVEADTTNADRAPEPEAAVPGGGT